MLSRRLLLSGSGIASATTWNPADKSVNITLSNSNLTTAQSAQGGVRATSNIATNAKVYWEIRWDSFALGGNTEIGLMQPSSSVTSGLSLGEQLNDIGMRLDNSQVTANNVVTQTGGGAFVAGDVAMIAVDQATGYVWFGRNGAWLYSGNPASGVNPAGTIPTTTNPIPALDGNNIGPNVATVRFGSNSWVYAAPSGFTLIP